MKTVYEYIIAVLFLAFILVAGFMFGFLVIGPMLKALFHL